MKFSTNGIFKQVCNLWTLRAFVNDAYELFENWLNCRWLVENDLLGLHTVEIKYDKENISRLTLSI